MGADHCCLAARPSPVDGDCFYALGMGRGVLELPGRALT